MRREFYRPMNPEIADRKTRFEALNDFVRSRKGWLTSVPGAPEVTTECLPGSSLPDDLRKLGYVVEEIGEGERILAACGCAEVRDIVIRRVRPGDRALDQAGVGAGHQRRDRDRRAVRSTHALTRQHRC
jgi:hypothetical protein